MMNNSVLQLYGSTTLSQAVLTNEQPAIDQMTCVTGHMTSHSPTHKANPEKSLTIEKLNPSLETQPNITTVPEDSVTNSPDIQQDSGLAQTSKSESRIKRSRKLLDEGADGDCPKKKRVKSKSDKSANVSPPPHSVGKSKQGNGMCTLLTYLRHFLPNISHACQFLEEGCTCMVIMYIIGIHT